MQRTHKNKSKKGGRGRQPLSISANNRNQLSTIVEMQMALFPPRTSKMLRYASGHFGLSSTSGVVTSYVFKINDCYDPDVTGTGHQPLGFDQMMGFYNHFCVTHCKATARFSTGTGNQGTASLRLDAGSTPITDIERIMEFGGNITTDLCAIGVFGSSKVLEISGDIAVLQGINRSALLADPTLRGDIAAAPTELSYLHVQLWNPAGVTVTANVYVVLELQVTFMEPRTAALS